jgi:uncharacterized protein YfaS (alpha-2-macroglobulin family)
MAEKLENPSGGRRSRWWIAAVLLGLGVLAAATAGIIWWFERSDDMGGRTNPVLVDKAGSDRQGQLGVEVMASGATQAQTLLIRLGPGQAQVEGVEQLPVTIGEPLSAEEIARILARLPELTVEAGDQVDFNLPDEVVPPPRPGETIDEPFPPPPPDVTPEPVASGPLEVLRFAPEGEIAMAPFLNVTFNQPMVPLATLDTLSAEQVPVQLDPPLPGTWRWIGTKTLRFEYASDLIDRLPKATEYVATVPAGTRSATGGVLAEQVRWTFRTPPVVMTTSYPSGEAQPLEPVIFIAFDQRIDPASVLATIRVTANGNPVAVSLASDEAIEQDERVSRLVKNAGDGRWLAFAPDAPLPADAAIEVVVGPGTPSAEGPLTTESEQRFSFRTYAPLRIERADCSWSTNDECRPLTPIYITFNNPIDVDVYKESMLTVEPAILGATVNIVGNTITISGATVGRTTYQLTVAGTIQDIYGQQLGKDTRLSVRIGPAESILIGPDKTLVTLDPAAEEPGLTLYTINYDRLRVRAYRVGAEDWTRYKTYLREYYRQGGKGTPPGREVMDETIRVEAAADALTEVTVDLRSALEGDTGHLIVVVEPATLLNLGNRDPYGRVVQVWVQVTQIGLDAFVDHSEMVAWTTALKDGSPLDGVILEADPGNQVAVTANGGIARFPLADGAADVRTDILIARNGDDWAILPPSPYMWSDGGWQTRPVLDQVRWYVFDDRGMYRPGEEVHVKGWLRRVGGTQTGDVGLLGDAVSDVRYQVVGPQGNELTSGRAQISALGGFDLQFTLPENANLGYAQLYLDAANAQGLDGTRYYHGFQIQEFRRPEFEVTARNETVGPYFVGGQGVVAVSANYYAGGALPNAEVTWNVTSSPGSYSPPNWPDFVFGTWTPWWFYRGPVYEEAWYGPYGAEEATVESYSGTTDAAGEHYLQLSFDQTDTRKPWSVLAEATVMDVNRQAWSASTTMLVHPAELYVGLRSDRTFVERGTPLKIDLIVTDLDGVPVPGRQIEVRAARLAWMYRQGSWREEEVDVQECTIASAAEPVTCTFETEVGGEYQITAVVTDAAGRSNQSQFTRWVSGGARPAAREVEQETVELIPDRPSYQPGDVAEILVQSPFGAAEGLLTVSRSGILYTERFALEGDSATLRIPIKEEHLPNLNLQVDLVGAAARTDDQGEPLKNVPERPAYATGQLTLDIPPLRRTLALEVAPAQPELEPGGETTVDVRLTDAEGRPVADAELAVVVVDEAILALTNYQLSDPIAVFYQSRPSDLSSYYGRSSIVLANPESLAAQANAGERAALVVEEVEVEKAVEFAAAPAAEPTMVAGYAEDAGAAAPIRVRTDFNPLATFSPEVRTDSDGRASVPVKVPDNLTRYRIMVVAVAEGTDFGSAEANLTARLPLMVRPSAPRFLNFGDQFELPIVVQNQTAEPMTVDVVVQAANLALTEGEGQRVTVPARDRVEVRFPATTVMAGTASLQIAAVSGSYADAATVEMPVYTPATTEAFATYGVVDEGAVAQPVAPPVGVFTQFGGLEISTSSTALQALTDAVLYLVSYPYDCSEQLASRILAVAGLRDVLTAFSAAGLPSPEQLEAAVRRDIDELAKLQNGDGGFPYWQRGRDSIPYNTIHVAHALQRADMMGFDVPADMKSNALAYLREIERHYPAWYSESVRQTLSAYALYTRDLMGDADRPKARDLLDKAGVEALPLEATAWLWQVLVDDPGSSEQLAAIRRHVNNRAVETAGAANFTTSYGEDAYVLLHSNRRTDALILDALIADDPTSDLIPKVVNGLLAHRTRGRWSNTQENVFILLALDHYFDVFEAQTPEFVARIWLGETYVGAHAYSGRTTERHETAIPMDFLAEETASGTQPLILSKEGVGRLYYRLGLRYAPTDLSLDPLDMGFVVQRVYEAVDDPDDVSRDENGVWHIRAGARVRVRLTMVADNRRYHVALVDPLPAGLEIVNPALAVSQSVPQDPNASNYRYGWWWWGPWYDHQNMRDERAEAFTPLLWEGVYAYTYIARATTPGTFVVPPAKAEEMYSPEVFGRSSSDWVVVK